jgi:hypothetical protein
MGELRFPDAGGLFGISEDYPAMARLSARFVDQILKGTPPGDLAVEYGIPGVNSLSLGHR